MKLCERCGKTLPQKDTERCPACGALQRANTRKDGFSHIEQEDFAPTEDRSPVAAQEGDDAFEISSDASKIYEDEPAQPHRQANSHKDRPRNGARRSGARSARITRDAQKDGNEKNKLLRVLAGIAVALAVLLAGTGIAAQFLYENYNAPKAFQALGKALLEQDITTLQGIVTTAQGKQPTDAQLTALCRLFSDKQSIAALQGQLSAQLEGDDTKVQYPALHPGEETVFLGYSSYTLQASPVALRVPSATATEGITLHIDGAAVTGTLTEQGAVYSDLFPGVYTCSVAAQSLIGETITGPEQAVTLMQTDAPTDFTGALPMGDVTVENCQSDEAEISVDGVVVAQKPVNGTVTLPRVRQGSAISMAYKTEYGAQVQASVQFTDLANRILRFEGHTREGGVPEEAALNTQMAAWFSSYLDARNTADPAKIVSCTEVLRAQQAGDVTSEESKQYTYLYKAAAVQMDSIIQAEYEGLPCIIFNAKFDYAVSHKETFQEENRVALYTVEIVYADGGWKTNRIMAVSQGDFDGKIFATLTK